jgi:hypothetical protein
MPIGVNLSLKSLSSLVCIKRLAPPRIPQIVAGTLSKFLSPPWFVVRQGDLAPPKGIDLYFVRSPDRLILSITVDRFHDLRTKCLKC